MIINGGAANGAVVEEESEVVTVAGGEEVFEDMTLQTGSAVSFAAGNESTSTPFSNPNILWGAAATAMLGATLAEWQRQRQEEEARRRAGNGGGGGGDEEEEEASDVIAKRRLKRLKKINPGLAYAEEQAKAVKDAIAAVTASELKAWEYDRTKTIEATDGYKESDNKGQYLKEALQDIRNQEAAYREEQARIAALVAQAIEAEKTDEEKLTKYKQSESYLGRQESYAEYYAQKENEEQAEAYRQALIAKNEEQSPVDMAKVNQLVQQNVSAARWMGVASVAQEKEESDASSQACFLPTEEAAPKADTISEGVSYLEDAVPGLRKMMAGIMLDGRPFKGGPKVKPLVNSKAMGGWAEWIYTRLGGKSGGVLNELELNQGVVGKSISSLDDAGSIVAKNAVKVTKGTWITAGVVSLVTNLYDYTIGEHKNEGLGQEFAVSTGVDILAAVGIGLAAAAIVSLAVASAPFTMSAAAVVGTTALVSIGISALFLLHFLFQDMLNQYPPRMRLKED